MANNIKGITVEIGGNVGPLASALQDVNTPINKVQSELKEVNKQLKFDPSNTTLLKQKQDLLAQSADALRQKQAVLKDALSQVQQQAANGDLGADKVRAVQREYEKVSSQLKDTEKEMANVGTSVGSLGDRIKSGFSQMGQSIKSAFTWENIKTSIGAVGVAVTGFLKSSVDEAKEAETANADLAQALKSTGGAAGMTMESLEKLSSSLSKSTTFSDDEVKAGESMLLTFTGIGKDVFPQATSAVLDYAQKMGVDAKSAALTLGKALNDPSEGLSKLTKSGVTFTDAQKEQIKAMQAAGDTAGAQKLMLQELNKEFGGQAAAAADTYEGKQKQLENTLKDVQETIGTAILPVIQKVLEAVTPVIQKIAEFVGEHPQLTAAILAVIAVVGTLIGGLSLLTTVTGAFGVTLNVALLPTIGLVVLAIAGIVTVIILVATHTKQIGEIASTVANAIKTAFLAAVNGIKAAWNGVAGFFKGIWSAITGVFSGIANWFRQRAVESVQAQTAVWNGLKAVFTAIWNGIKIAVMAIVTPFVKGITNIWNGMKDGIQTIMAGLQNILGGIWNVIKNVVLGPVLLIIDLVTGNFTKLHDDAVGIFTNLKNAFGQIWTGIKQVFAGVVQAIAGFLTTEWNGIVNTATAVFNTLAAFFANLWNGIKNVAVTVWNALVSFFTGLPGTIGNIMSSIGSWVRGVWDGLVGFIANIPSRFLAGLSGLGNAVRAGFQDAISFITNLPSEALQWGKDIINGIVNGIKNAAKAVSDAVQGVAQDIRKFLHFSEPDVGPLVGFHGWWKDMMYGMAEDITSNIAPVAAAARSVAASVASNIGGSMSLISTPASTLTAARNASYSTANVTNNNTKAPVININGPVNVGDKGNQKQTLQQLQFLAVI